MKRNKLLSLVFWPVVIVAPFLATFIAAAQFPPGVEAPLHWDFSGQVDGWGSPWMMLPVSLIMSAANALMRVMYCCSDKMYDIGLVHGVSRKGVRPLLAGTAIVLVIVIVVILVWWAVSAQSVM